jgi:cytoskeleton protein RodZ
MNEVDMESKEPAVRPNAPAAAPPSTGGRGARIAIDDDGSFGRALAAAREARGLSQSDVAAQLRLHVRQVKALEAEDLALLPEGAFVRGYVRNYAKLVDLPPEPLLALVAARLKPTDPLHSQVNSAAVSPIQRTPREPVSGLVVIGAVLAVLAVLGAFGWWSMRERTPAPAPAASVPEPAPAAVPAPAPPPAADTPAPSSSAAVPEAPATAEAQAPAAPAGAQLQLSFRDRSWVEIRQADGTILMQQNNAAGTTRTVEGTPPYTLVIGNASKVDLQFRGEPVDLSDAIRRDDIARLRLE